MFPPLLCLFLLFSLLFRFPPGKLPLPLLALKERLNFREQDTGEDFRSMKGYSDATVVGLLLAWHGITPLEPFLVKQIAYNTAPFPVMKQPFACVNICSAALVFLQKGLP